MFSYAGVVLPDPPPDVLSRVRRHLSYDYLALWDQPWQATGARPWLSEGPLRLNTLLWPSGASRWAVFHAVIDDAAMNAVRGATGSFGQPLVIDGGTGPALSVTMYPLPPRPLSQIAGANGFQLLTLVDRRAYWPWVAADPVVTGGSTTWTQLFAAVADALGVPVLVDSVPEAYPPPPTDILDANDGLPALLDAACRSCGLRLAAGFDGTYRCWSPAAARQQLAANLAGVTNPRAAGGTFLQGTDVNGILPAAVRLVFPRSDDGDLAAAREARPVTLASLGAGGPAGNTGGIGGLTRTLYSTALATYAGGSLTNDAALTALAAQAAADWYGWQAAGNHDIAFAGVAPWVPTGADGMAEYAHAPDRGAGGGVLSRFRRDTYFDQQSDLFHWTADLAPPTTGSAPPFSGAYLTSSGQTIANNTLTTLTWATAGYDTDGYFSSGLPTRLTASAAGYYRITARVNWNIGPAVAALILALAVNGTSTYEADYAHAEATTITESNSLTTVAHLAAGDYVQVQVKQTSGGNMSFLTGSGNSPTFQIEKVG